MTILNNLSNIDTAANGTTNFSYRMSRAIYILLLFYCGTVTWTLHYTAIETIITIVHSISI